MDQITEKISRWSLERVQFLLSHLEDFIEGDEKEFRDRARGFMVETGLENVGNLIAGEPSHPQLPLTVLDRISSFFDCGLLLQQSPAPEGGNWWATDLFWRGNMFHLDLNDQIRASALIPEIAPLQISRAPAAKILKALGLEFMVTRPDAEAYLLRPAPNTAYVLISSLGSHWSENHMLQTQRLINKSFIY